MEASGRRRAVCAVHVDGACAAPLRCRAACPASLLKAENLYPSYKGPSAEAAGARGSILKGLISRNLMQRPAPALRGILLENKGGDALDAVIAAIIAIRARNDPTSLRPRDSLEAIETRVFC